MKEVFEWISSLDLAVIYTAVIGFATTWGGSIIALVVSVIRHRVKDFNYKQALEKVKIELNNNQTAQIEALRNDLLNTLADISKGLISKENEHAEERMKAIQQLTDDVNAANEELQEAFNPYDIAKELK